MARAVTNVLLLALSITLSSSAKDPVQSRNYRSLSDLDSNNVLNLDKLVRQDLIFSILKELNQTALQQNRLARQCDLKINQSLSSCQTCETIHTCTGGINIHLTYSQLLPTVYRPVLLLGEVVGTIQDTVGDLSLLLGNLAGGFLNGLGNIASDLSNGLLGGGGKLFSGFGNGLATIATNLGKAASNIIRNPAGVILGLEQGANALLQGASGLLGPSVHHAGDGLLQTVAQTGSSLVHGAGNLLTGAVNVLGSLFGRRASDIHIQPSCVQTCSVCGVVDTKLHTTQEIIYSVCGGSVIEQQATALQTIKNLQQLYNTTILSQLITQVQYDPSSVNMESGVSFSKVFVNSVLGTFPSHVPLSLTDMKTTAKGIAQEIIQSHETIEGSAVV